MSEGQLRFHQCNAKGCLLGVGTVSSPGLAHFQMRVSFATGANSVSVRHKHPKGRRIRTSSRSELASQFSSLSLANRVVSPTSRLNIYVRILIVCLTAHSGDEACFILRT